MKLSHHLKIEKQNTLGLDKPNTTGTSNMASVQDRLQGLPAY